jgi:hypothetical protein
VALGLLGFVIWEIYGPADAGTLATASRMMAWVSTAAAIVVPVAIFATFLFPEQTAPLNLRLYHFGGRELTSAIPLGLRLFAFACAAIPLTIVVRGLLSLRRLFVLYARREVFSPEALVALSTVATAVFWYVLASFLVEAPISAALSWNSGRGTVTLSIGLDDLAPLYLAGVATIITRVMTEARRVAEENASFV